MTVTKEQLANVTAQVFAAYNSGATPRDWSASFVGSIASDRQWVKDINGAPAPSCNFKFELEHYLDREAIENGTLSAMYVDVFTKAGNDGRAVRNNLVLSTLKSASMFSDPHDRCKNMPMTQLNYTCMLAEMAHNGAKPTVIVVPWVLADMAKLCADITAPHHRHDGMLPTVEVVPELKDQTTWFLFDTSDPNNLPLARRVKSERQFGPTFFDVENESTWSTREEFGYGYRTEQAIYTINPARMMRLTA